MNVTKLVPIAGKLRKLLTKKQKIYLLVLLFLTIFLSIVETVSVSVIMPFISAASNPDIIDNGIYARVYNFFNFSSKIAFVTVFGFVIVAFYIFRALYNTSYTYILNTYALGMYKYFAKKLFNVFLKIQYRLYLQRNSGELLQLTVAESANASLLVQNVLLLCTESFTIALLYSFMIIVNWKMTLVLTAILILLVFGIVKIIVRKSKIYGEKKYGITTKLNKIIIETFGNFKIVKLKNLENQKMDEFSNQASLSARVQVLSATISGIPKNILESTGFSLLVVAVIYILWVGKSPASIIPIISMYALGLYRILPSINRLLSNVSQIAFLQYSLDRVYDNINQEIEIEGNEDISFDKNIKLENISFEYMRGGKVLHDVSLEIKKGEKVAITGESGGGKSTLVDIIIGIHKPIGGKLYIDNTEVTSNNICAWKKRIGYIPQTIYLFDGTVCENVIFGSEYNEEKLRAALLKANIWDFLAEKDGINTLVGEGGIQLSGGQKQRIGIARALYDDPDVLVLDEATSSLDTETEQKIMDEIYNTSENKTLIVIAHRLSTVERCERRINIEKGRIVE